MIKKKRVAALCKSCKHLQMQTIPDNTQRQIVMTDKSIIHDSAELRQLIAENPKLPIVVLAGENANTGDYG